MKLALSYKHLKRHKPFSVTIVFLAAMILICVYLVNSNQVRGDELIIGLAASFLRLLVAFCISLALALPAALLITYSQKSEDFFLPLFDVLQSLPGLAILPLAIKVFGSSEVAAIFILVTAMLWSIMFALVSGIKNLRQDLVEAADVFGAKGVSKLWSFLIPGLFPSVVTGSIIAWGAGWEVIVGAELLGIKTGIGAFLNSANGNSTVLVIGIGALGILIFILNKMVWLPLLRKSSMYQNE